MSRHARAVVFAYHDVGVRCLKVLLEAGVEIGLVVTHQDAPHENIWFESVAETAALYGLPCITPEDPNTKAVLERCRQAQPDVIFSFYYRQMLKAPLLSLARLGAYNMHGSLLPKYRGRVPINWAVLHGEHETGATLHLMHPKPDCGPIVDQMAVPILRDDTAHQVLTKVVLAAEMVLMRALPALLDGTAVLRPQDLRQGAYFGGRRPEDGRLPVDAGTQALHNLVRAVAPPYPGAFLDILDPVSRQPRRLTLLRTHILAPAGAGPCQAALAIGCATTHDASGLSLVLYAADGGQLQVLACTLDSHPWDASQWKQHWGAQPLNALAG
jgi:methionyl-tRNA formyltransferase